MPFDFPKSQGKTEPSPLIGTDSVRARIEMYAGRKLKVERDPREWGTLRTFINGRPAGSPYGRDAAALDKALIQLRRDVDGADERRAMDGNTEAYGSEVYQGAPALTPLQQAWGEQRRAREAADRAAISAPDPTPTQWVNARTGALVVNPGQVDIVRGNVVKADSDEGKAAVEKRRASHTATREANLKIRAQQRQAATVAKPMSMAERRRQAEREWDEGPDQVLIPEGSSGNSVMGRINGRPVSVQVAVSGEPGVPRDLYVMGLQDQLSGKPNVTGTVMYTGTNEHNGRTMLAAGSTFWHADGWLTPTDAVGQVVRKLRTQAAKSQVTESELIDDLLAREVRGAYRRLAPNGEAVTRDSLREQINRSFPRGSRAGSHTERMIDQMAERGDIKLDTSRVKRDDVPMTTTELTSAQRSLLTAVRETGTLQLGKGDGPIANALINKGLIERLPFPESNFVRPVGDAGPSEPTIGVKASSKPVSKLTYVRDASLRLVAAIEDQVGKPPATDYAVPGVQEWRQAASRAAYSEQTRAALGEQYGATRSYGATLEKLEELGYVKRHSGIAYYELTEKGRQHVDSTSAPVKPEKKEATKPELPSDERARQVMSAVNTADQARALGFEWTDTPLTVGDEVMVSTFGKLRGGIVTRVGTKNVAVAYMTPSGGYVQTTSAENAHVMRKVGEPQRGAFRGQALQSKPPAAPKPTAEERAAAKAERDAIEKARVAKSNEEWTARKVADIRRHLAEGDEAAARIDVGTTSDKGLRAIAREFGIKSTPRGMGDRQKTEWLRNAILEAAKKS